MGDVAGVPEEIWAALGRGATVLTGKQRAARDLQRSVDRANRSAGLGSWAPARIFAWDGWVAGLWHRLVLDGAVDRMLLNRTQERALWTEAIEGDAKLSTLRSAGALAGLAAEAWGGLARYGGLARLRGSATNSDAEAFARWAGVFEERCREGGYVPQARLEGAVRRVWREMPESVAGERDIVLVGFDRVLPAQNALLDDLRGAGCQIAESQGVLAGRRLIWAAEDEGEERMAAARWARGVLERRPGARVAVIVPGLSESEMERAALARVFREVLAPEAQAMTVDSPRLPYEFSTGVRLDRTEVVAVALALVGWAREAMRLDELGRLLLSRHFAGGGERSARAEFDAYELRRRTILRPEVTLDDFVEIVERSTRRDRLGELLTSLRRLQGVVRRSFGAGEERPYSDWAEAMREMLGAAGWAAGCDSLEFQARERWESVLDELATMDFEGGRVPAERALDLLCGIAEGTTFAGKSLDAPVQVMGPEEAAGLRFDAVWMMRAGDLSWPPGASGSALLSWPLRRELGMPGSDVGADAEHARRLTHRIAASASEVVFSYARRTGEEQEVQRASPSLRGLGLEETSFAGERRAGREVELEEVEDGGVVAALPERTISGGVGVLKAQAACAFHAFAEYRLFATGLETRALGMDASERGRAVHGMLEHFWDEVRAQAALKRMTSEERREVLGRAIETTLTRMRVDAEEGWDGAYVNTERERLMRLGMAWLELEEARSIPFTVEKRESEEKDVAVGPLRLSLRLDRVDSTDEGAVLMDYKTGAFGAASWLGERPDEPQLPLYAALVPLEKLHAVAFGLVRAGEEMKLSGYATGPGTLRETKLKTATLEEQVEAWREVVVGLAEGFAAGDARVLPKVYPQTCKYCAHRLICRLEVGSLHEDEGEEFDGEVEGG